MNREVSSQAVKDEKDIQRRVQIVCVLEVVIRLKLIYDYIEI